MYGSQRFYCKGGRKIFNALTGMPFSRLRHKEKLLENAACMADCLSVCKTAKRLGISVDKALRWCRKFLECLDEQKPSELSGVVEAGEPFSPVSYKGRKKALSHRAKKRGGGREQGRFRRRKDARDGGRVAGRTGGVRSGTAGRDQDLTQALKPVWGRMPCSAPTATRPTGRWRKIWGWNLPSSSPPTMARVATALGLCKASTATMPISKPGCSGSRVLRPSTLPPPGLEAAFGSLQRQPDARTVPVSCA